MLLNLEESVKNMLVPGTLFEELGFRYVGPVDGHDLDALVDTLTQVRKWHGARLVHVRTVKGKGFNLAEANPVVWHGAMPFDKLSGQMASKKGLPAYTTVFGRGLAELGARNPKMAVITAAMPSGTGAGVFGDAFPERYFDVGIAEGHAVTFAAGLATEGIRPVAAIYSTFLQRAYDSVIHDVAIQNLPVVFAMDRAGLVGNDGPTHAGLYDIAYLLAIPNMVVTAPKDGAELLALLRLGVEETRGPFSVRYPRDAVPAIVPPLDEIPRIPFGSWEILRRGGDLALLATGTMVLPALEAADQLAAEGIEASVVNCRFLKPMDAGTLGWVVAQQSFLVLQPAMNRQAVLAYLVLSGRLATRAALSDAAEVDVLAETVRQQFVHYQRTPLRRDEVDGATILAAWLRDRGAADGSVFRIDDDSAPATQMAEWRAACAMLLRSGAPVCADTCAHQPIAQPEDERHGNEHPQAGAVGAPSD